MKILKLLLGNDVLEVQYNQQSGQVYIAEAQIQVIDKDGTEVNIFIDEVEDIDALISELTVIRDKMIKHYAAKPTE